MAFIAELTLSDPVLFCPTFEEAPKVEMTFEDVHYVTDEGTIHYVIFCWVSGCAFADYEEALQGDPTVRKFRAVTDVADRRLYRIVTREFPEDQPLAYPLYREYDITAIESRRTTEGFHMRARFPSRNVLRQFREQLAESGSSLELKRVYAENPGDTSEPTLTERQRDALVLAARHGYFASPREVTLAELADELEITPQTLSRHLRVAVRKLVEDEVEAATDR